MGFSKIPFDIQPEMSPKYKFQKVSGQEIEAIDEEIEKLKQKIVKKEVHHEDEEFIYPIFVSPKKDRIYKLILNLKDLNQYIEYNQFKMHGLQEILELVTPLCKMASLDIKDAYYSTPVGKGFQKY